MSGQCFAVGRHCPQRPDKLRDSWSRSLVLDYFLTPVLTGFILNRFYSLSYLLKMRTKMFITFVGKLLVKGTNEAQFCFCLFVGLLAMSQSKHDSWFHTLARPGTHTQHVNSNSQRRRSRPLKQDSAHFPTSSNLRFSSVTEIQDDMRD